MRSALPALTHPLPQDALFARGTSATPDLPSAGKRLPRGLFSPAGPRSGSASGGKVAPRRGLLHGVDVTSPAGPSAHDTEDDKLGSQPSCVYVLLGTALPSLSAHCVALLYVLVAAPLAPQLCSGTQTVC